MKVYVLYEIIYVDDYKIRYDNDWSETKIIGVYNTKKIVKEMLKRKMVEYIYDYYCDKIDDKDIKSKKIERLKTLYNEDNKSNKEKISNIFNKLSQGHYVKSKIDFCWEKIKLTKDLSDFEIYFNV